MLFFMRIWFYFRCISPVSDITFFLYACTSYDLLIEHWDEILIEYHKVFCEFLTDLGSSPDIFPFDDFKNDFKRNGIYGIAMAMEALPFQMMDDSETADLDAIQVYFIFFHLKLLGYECIAQTKISFC